MSAAMAMLYAAFTFAAASVGAQTTALPTALSDAEFWRMFSTFSEAGGTFTTENFTSNEVAVGQVATMLRAGGHTGGAYIGVGPEQNFTYIAAIEPRIAFIVDIRRQAAIQHLMFKAVFELSSTRSDFIERLFSLRAPSPPRPRVAPIHDLWLDYLNIKPDTVAAARNLEAIRKNLTVTHKFDLSPSDLQTLSHVYTAFVQAGPVIHYLTGMPTATPTFRSANFASLTMTVDSAANPRSFLATQRNFDLVKDMHARNMIIPVVGDFAGARGLRSVGTYLRNHGTTVTAFYVSNVEQYLFRPVDKRQAFYDNVAALPLDSNSVLIRPGAAGSTPLRTPPLTPSSSDSEVRVYVEQLRVPGSEPRPLAPLCQALQFLNAFRSGRVTVAADAERCAR